MLGLGGGGELNIKRGKNKEIKKARTWSTSQNDCEISSKRLAFSRGNERQTVATLFPREFCQLGTVYSRQELPLWVGDK